MIKNVTDKLKAVAVFEGGTQITTIVDGLPVASIQGGTQVMKVPSRPLTLKYNGYEKVIAPGESLDVVDCFNVTKESAPLVEARFSEKFGNLVEIVDTNAEKKAITATNRKDKLAKVEAAVKITDLTVLLAGESDTVIIDAVVEKINSLDSETIAPPPEPAAPGTKEHVPQEPPTEIEATSYTDLLAIARAKGLTVQQNMGREKVLKLLADLEKSGKQ